MCRDGPFLPEQQERFIQQSSRQKDTVNFQFPGMIHESGYQLSSSLPFTIDRPRTPRQYFPFSAQIRAASESATIGKRLRCDNCSETFNCETDKLAHFSVCGNIHDKYI